MYVCVYICVCIYIYIHDFDMSEYVCQSSFFNYVKIWALPLKFIITCVVKPLEEIIYSL